jgi:predicted DNA-binding protein with PD1-like motif
VRTKLIAESERGRRYVLVLDWGDELMAEVKAFAERERLRAAEFTGIGAISSAKLAAFDPDTREYVDIPDPGQTELASLNGRITLPQDADPANPPAERQLHVHCVLSRHDGSAVGGHVLELVVRPTAEVFVTEGTEHIARGDDPHSGLPVISLD